MSTFEAKKQIAKIKLSKMRYTITMPVEINHKSQLEFGKKLREIREQRRLFQEDVAKSVGISITYYAGIERGEENPTYSVLEQICKVLKVKSSEILPF